MNTLLIILWFLTGWASFVYWWTRNHDLTFAHLLFSFIPSILGPIAFIVGWCIHGQDTNSFMDIVVFKKKD